MASQLRILVAEGNTAEARSRVARLSGQTPGESYAAVLRDILPEVTVDLCCPADAADPPVDIASYDGVVITGSALNAYHDMPEVRRQVEFSRAVFHSGVAFFGSCWGLQIASVAAGGEVALNPKPREVGFARNIYLTDAGITHPMHAGRRRVFDALAIHSDHVVRPPPECIITASNGHSPIQAAEIRSGRGIFWGVQYHPEFDLLDVAQVILRYGQKLVEEGFFADMAALDACAASLTVLAHNSSRSDIAWQFSLWDDILSADKRTTEIANWIRKMVEGR
ncbi:MAG TPA: type 1 glutamine amidotransferase [Rhizobium sp.]